jgi:hypothetical protein
VPDVTPLTHRDAYPLTPDECAAIAEAAETWCRRWSAFLSPSIADVSPDIAARLSRSAPTFRRRSPTEMRRHGALWALHVQQGWGLTLRPPVIEGQHYLVVNVDDYPRVSSIWVLWDAERRFFPREPRSDVRRFVFQPQTERHVEDVLERATYRLARVPFAPVSVVAAMIAERTCPHCRRQAGRAVAVATFTCRVCCHHWTVARAGGASGA